MKIKKVSLMISNFEETVKFYQNTLQFRLLSLNNKYASFQIGESILEFNKDFENHHYYYHFAFNIHANLFSEAKEWLSNRLTLLKEDGSDEIHFDGKTQANACYFEDPAGNIVELIARRVTSPLSIKQEFTIDNILSISEISYTTSKMKESYEELKRFGILIRENDKLNEMSLNFIGDYAEGAFILLGPIGRRWLFSNKNAIQAPVSIQTNKGIIHHLNF